MSQPHRTARHATVQTENRAARLAAAGLRAGRPSAEHTFDQLLPSELRDVSAKYWTTLPVVRRAAVWLRETGVRNVVDIGSGAGKFCVAAALLTRCRFVGVEHRQALVVAARELASVFAVSDRVSFVAGDLADVAAIPADAYYLFNPFNDYGFDSPRFADPDVVFSPEGQAEDIASTGTLLAHAPAGTIVITYNGFGGRLPDSYEQLDRALHLPGTLRLWKQR